MKFLSRSICAASVCAVLAGLSASVQAWDKWDAFKAANVNESFRVVDYSDNRRITTSEGQSYAMFFALVAGDKDAFDKLLVWTENNLASGDITKYKPAWLWGKHGSSWGIIDSNNAADSDMWIAYCLLEAGRLWERPDYTAKGKAMTFVIGVQNTALAVTLGITYFDPLAAIPGAIGVVFTTVFCSFIASLWGNRTVEE